MKAHAVINSHNIGTSEIQQNSITSFYDTHVVPSEMEHLSGLESVFRVQHHLYPWQQTLLGIRNV